MASLKTTWASRRAFLVLDDSIRWRELSFEAIGLWAHIESRRQDEIDTAALQTQFPDYDIAALIAELLDLDIIIDGSLPQAPIVEEYELGGRRPSLGRVPGFVYVVEANGYFKIGVTKSLNARLKQLQTAHHQRLEFLWHRRVADPAALELRLHTILQPLRQSGEWFACTREQLDDALRLGVFGHEELKP